MISARLSRCAVACVLLLLGVQPLQASEAQTISFANHTDAELTELGAQWEELSNEERRALLAEVKMRMARDRGRSGVLKIRTTRQYGVVRKPDGTTVRVERQVVHVQPVTDPNGAGKRGAKVTFGIGFERRQGAPGEAPDTPQEAGPEAPANQPPVLRASTAPTDAKE